MLFRASEGSVPTEVSLDELRAIVRTGSVKPTVLVRDPLLTRDEWWTIDNLRLFHNCSPVAYAPGEHLLRQVAEREASMATSAMFAEWFVQYTRGDVVERALGLKSLGEITNAPGVFGASRLFVRPAFLSETLCTFVFGTLGITIQVAEAERMVWHRHHAEPVDVTVREGQVENKEGSESLDTWSKFLAAAESAVDCEFLMCDGRSFRHKVRVAGDRSDLMDVDWFNPSKQDRSQWRLLETYLEWLQIAGLDGGLREQFRSL
jgi:hypothetical protein